LAERRQRSIEAAERDTEMEALRERIRQLESNNSESDESMSNTQ
jgi:hypothetical protein